MAAVFFDRDGVLNELVERDGRAVSPRRLTEFRIVRDARAQVQRVRAAGLRVFVVTNQPDLARGHMTREELEAMTARLIREVEPDEVAICPHDDADDCRCRKPSPGMLLDLRDRWGIDLCRSFMVGDSWRDIEAGKLVGCRTIFVTSAPDTSGADFVAGSLSEAIDWILKSFPPSG